MIHLNVQASDASQLAELWEHLRGCTSTVDIVDGDMHITVDLGDRAFLALVDPLPADTVAEPEVRVPFEDALEYAVGATGTEDLEVVHPPAKPEVRPLDNDRAELRQLVLDELAESKQTAGVIAAAIGVEVPVAKSVLAGLREDGMVRLAGAAGWALTDEPAAPIKHTPVDHDTARRRAAEAM